MAKKKTSNTSTVKSGGLTKKGNYLLLGKHSYKISWLKNVTQRQAISILKGVGRDIGQINNAWKRANGLSIRNEDK